METFSTLLAICAGNSPVPGEFPTQRPVTQSFDIFFDWRLNKRLNKQSSGWWFETLSPHYDVTLMGKKTVSDGCFKMGKRRFLVACFNIKILTYQYIKSQWENKMTATWHYLHNESSLSSNMALLCWNVPFTYQFCAKMHQSHRQILIKLSGPNNILHIPTAVLVCATFCCNHTDARKNRNKLILGLNLIVTA